MSLLILSGISGAGKSTACNVLEDMGYFCIDNLPPSLLMPIAKLQAEGSTIENMLVVIDSRSLEMYESLSNELLKLKENGYSYTLMFLYCRDEVILNRYKQTRRKHPMSSETISLEEAIARDYEITKPIMDSADIVIDTSYLTAQQFRQTVLETFKERNYDTMNIKLVSFGYRNGLPADADLVIDVRCLPNPYYIPDLKNHNGLEDCVYDYIFKFDQSHVFVEKLYDFIDNALPNYSTEGKNELIIAVGCTGGHHRSVAVVQYLYNRLKNSKYHTIAVHRDIDKNY